MIDALGLPATWRKSCFTRGGVDLRVFWAWAGPLLEDLRVRGQQNRRRMAEAAVFMHRAYLKPAAQRVFLMARRLCSFMGERRMSWLRDAAT